MQKKNFKKFWESVLEILYPSDYKCVFCSCELNKKTPSLTCEACEKKLPKLFGEKLCEKCGDKIFDIGNYCFTCKNGSRNFDIARAPFLYEEPINQAIRKFKFENAKYLFKPMSAYLSKCYYDYGFDADCVMAVPMFKSGQKLRGYNQAEKLAENLAKFVNLPFKKDILIKCKKTHKQVGLDFLERSKNIKASFKVSDKKFVKGKIVLLVDDVLTSGATCDECAKTLKKAGAKKVIVLTLARTHISNNK